MKIYQATRESELAMLMKRCDGIRQTDNKKIKGKKLKNLKKKKRKS